MGEALIEAASPQIRNLATLAAIFASARAAGIPQRSRFVAQGRDRQGIGGGRRDRYHAILGNDGPAKFVSPSTVVPVLIAYGAMVRIEGPKGKRELPLEKFFGSPGPIANASTICDRMKSSPKCWSRRQRA